MKSSSGISYSSGRSYFDRHSKTEEVQDRACLAHAGLELFCKRINSLKGDTDEATRKSRLDWLDYCKDINKGRQGRPVIRIDSRSVEALSPTEYEEVVSGSVQRMMKTKDPFIVPVTSKNVKLPKREKNQFLKKRFSQHISRDAIRSTCDGYKEMSKRTIGFWVIEFVALTANRMSPTRWSMRTTKFLAFFSLILTSPIRSLWTKRILDGWRSVLRET